MSASRRTDIPAFYPEWLCRRIQEGFVLVRNPMNAHQISTITLTPDAVDCIVFWTKNPQPMFPYLDALQSFHYYFQFTLNAYHQDVETNVPDKMEIIDTFKKLSDKLGPHRVIWRYDPVLLNPRYTIEYHLEYFAHTARSLQGYTEKVTISFIDWYSKTKRGMAGLEAATINETAQHTIARQLAYIARENSLRMDTCAESADFTQYGITRARCIDADLVRRITGRPIDIPNSTSQRAACGCAASVDIGAYNTCRHGCRYCYANNNPAAVTGTIRNHRTASPVLIGEYTENSGNVQRELNFSFQ